MARGVRDIYVGGMLQQVVINFQRIRQRDTLFDFVI